MLEVAIGFYLDGASFTQKINPFDEARAMDKYSISVSLEQEFSKAWKQMLLTL